MPLNNELLRSSFELVVERAPNLTERFYDILFARYPQTRGRRVVIGVPGIGFRGDLRADNAVIQGSRTFVPVLTEQEYYRAELHHIEAFAILVPVDRVWVEEPGAPPGDVLQALDVPPVRNASPATANEPLLVRARIESIDEGPRRVLVTQRIVTGTKSAPEATTSDLRVFIPLGKPAKSDATSKEKPRVPVDAREIAFLKIGAAGRWILNV